MNDIDANLRYNQQRTAAELWLRENRDNPDINPFFISFIEEALDKLINRPVIKREVVPEEDKRKHRLKVQENRMERRRLRNAAARQVKEVYQTKVTVDQRVKIIQTSMEVHKWVNDDGIIPILYDTNGFALPGGIAPVDFHGVPHTAIIVYVALSITKTLEPVSRKAAWQLAT